MRYPLRTLFMISLLGLSLSCASSSAGNSHAARIELLSVVPPLSEPMAPTALVVATLRYSIPDFRPDTFLISPQFNATTAGATSSGADEDWQVLTSAAGEARVSFPLAEVLQNPSVAKPLRMRFFLHERLGGGRTNAIARTEPVDLTVMGR